MTTTRWQVRRARRKRHVAPCLLGYEQLSGRPSVPVSRVSGEGFSPFAKIAEDPILTRLMTPFPCTRACACLAAEKRAAPDRHTGRRAAWSGM